MGKKRRQRKRLRKVLRELTAVAVGVLAKYAAEQLRDRQHGAGHDDGR